MIRKASQQEHQTRNENGRRRDLRDRRTQLTRGQRELLGRIVDGKANQKIAAEIGVSLGTVENRRLGLLQKRGTNSVAKSRIPK